MSIVLNMFVVTDIVRCRSGCGFNTISTILVLSGTEQCGQWGYVGRCEFS